MKNLIFPSLQFVSRDVFFQKNKNETRARFRWHVTLAQTRAFYFSPKHVRSKIFLRVDTKSTCSHAVKLYLTDNAEARNF